MNLTILPATLALALACVASPALAGGKRPEGDTFSAMLSPGLAALGLAAVGVGVLALLCSLLFDRREPLKARLFLVALIAAVLAIGVVSPSLAAELGTVGGTAVILPWGDWLVAIAQMAGQILLPILLPAVAGYVILAIRSNYPWLALVLTQERLEQMGRALTDYALNSVEGAAKGKTLSVDVGSRVVAAGVQRGLETVPAAVIKAAGGAEGIAKIIFRQLPLEERASAAKVIPTALAQASGKEIPIAPARARGTEGRV